MSPVTFRNRIGWSSELALYKCVLEQKRTSKNKDTSFVKDYSEAIDKIKSILRYTIKNKANLLADRTQYDQTLNQERNSDNLSDLQNALTNYKLVKIQYINREGTTTSRIIKPFALLSTENWYLIAWCRLRKEFRLDRIQQMEILSENVEPHHMTLEEYFDQYH
ncbi:WYL domain-containing protein [Rapidithrix thailandica]|uniref:WYL domain-containing protein n=1 Tax=Rapidithrix thailandica TaxID=413964 RepID=A0AAW9SFJ4_9BACT